MIFNSLVFAVFFAIVLILHGMPFSWRTKKINLLVASYILLWVSTVVDWFAARGLAEADDPWKRRAWMLPSVVVSLGLLCYFKYGHFLLENFTPWRSLRPDAQLGRRQQLVAGSGELRPAAFRLQGCARGCGAEM